MPSCYDVVRNMPLGRIPADQRSLSEKALAQQDAAVRKSSESRATKSEAIVENARRQVHDLLGAEGLATLGEAKAAARRAMRDRQQPPAGLGLDLDEANAMRRKNLDSTVKKLGADPGHLRAIGAATGKDLMAVLGTPAGIVTHGFNLHDNLAKWTELSSLHMYPLDWGVRPPVTDPNQWQVFGPEFPLWNLAYDHIENRFAVRREYLLYEQFGVVGQYTTMDGRDVDDFGYAQAIVDTEAVFIYQAPASGRLEVIIDASNFACRHQLRIHDEWGWSEHSTGQHNYLSLNVFHPNITERSLALMSEFAKRGNEDNSWDEQHLTPGSHYYAHLLSNGTVQAGDTFFVGVGTRTFGITGSNDVEVHSGSHFEWAIRTVEVRVVP